MLKPHRRRFNSVVLFDMMILTKQLDVNFLQTVGATKLTHIHTNTMKLHSRSCMPNKPLFQILYFIRHILPPSRLTQDPLL